MSLTLKRCRAAGCFLAKAISYIRFSSEGQSEGDSLRRQTARSEAYAAKHGLELVRTYRDLGLSGFKGHHREKGALRELLELVESGQIEKGTYLLVESWDRLSRLPVLEAHLMFLNLIQKGIVLVTLNDEQVFTTESVNQQWTQLIISLNEMQRAYAESKRKSDLLSESWKAKRAKVTTEKMTSVAPAWLRLVDGRFEPLPERVAIIRRIFEELADHNIGKAKIAARLNAEGVQSWGRRKKDGSLPTWHASMVQKLVQGRAVLGEFQPHKIVDGTRVPVGDPVPGYFPAVVPVELYHRAQAAMSHRQSGKHVGRKGPAYSNLFSRVATCDECGAGMVFRNKGPKPRGGTYLACGAALRRAGCGNTRHFPYPEFEQKFLRLVGEIDLSVGGKADTSKLRAQLAEAVHQREVLARKIDVIADQLIAIPSETLRNRLMAAEEAKRALDGEVRQLRRDIQAVESKPAPNSHQEAVRSLMAEMDSTDDLYAVRSRVAGAIRNVVDDIRFEANGTVTVIILDGAIAYRVTDEGSETVNLTSLIGVPGGVPAESFTRGNDPERAHELKRVAALGRHG